MEADTEQPKTALDAWMAKKGHDDDWLGSALGIDRSQASRIRRGVSGTSPARAFAIEKLTRGAVKAASILLPDRAA